MKYLVVKCFQITLIFANEFEIPIIKLGKRFAKFMISISLFQFKPNSSSIVIRALVYFVIHHLEGYESAYIAFNRPSYFCLSYFRRNTSIFYLQTITFIVIKNTIYNGLVVT